VPNSVSEDLTIPSVSREFDWAHDPARVKYPRDYIRYTVEEGTEDLRQALTFDWGAQQEVGVSALVLLPDALRSSAELSVQFAELAERWRADTAFTSSLTDIVLNAAYQRIIGLGPDVVPLILGELRRRGVEQWFWALTALTGYEPEGVAEGDLQALHDAWLSWGTRRALVRSSSR